MSGRGHLALREELIVTARKMNASGCQRNHSSAVVRSRLAFTPTPRASDSPPARPYPIRSATDSSA